MQQSGSSQSGMSQAASRADTGIAQAAGKVDRLDAGWIDAATNQVRAFACRAGKAFTIESARASCTPPPEGADQRVWGAVTRRAVKSGFIERIPGKFAAAASSNGSPKPMYQPGPNAAH